MLRYSLMNAQEFQNKIYAYFLKHKRILPWRYEKDPYKVFVSEVMLQQTPVARVLVKYPEFIKRFPTFRSLADASLRDVFTVWQGMGYNRRAKYLKEAAGIITKDKRYEFMFHNILSFPRTRESIELNRSRIKSGMTDSNILQLINILQMLPGIGQATACAMITYAFNMPTVFVETNIRAVYLFHFFPTSPPAGGFGGTSENIGKVSDKEIMDLAKKTLDRKNPRDWYYALTDYGAMLKREKKFQNIQSKRYARQSKFEGSRRQLRGRIIKTLLEYGPNTFEQIDLLLPKEERLESVLNDLETERMIEKNSTGQYCIINS